MAIKIFSKIRKPKGFNYNPQYYDEAKEQLEEKLKRYNVNKSPEEAPDVDQIAKSKDNIRSTFRKKQNGVFKGGTPPASATSQSRQSNIRLVRIIAILAIITYLILKSEFILNFVQKISG